MATTENNARPTLIPGLQAAQVALERLTAFGEKNVPDFPAKSVRIVGNFVDAISFMGEPAARAVAQQQQLRGAIHSLKRIAEGLDKPTEYAEIALRHLLGPQAAADLLKDKTTALPPAVPAGPAFELSAAMEDAFIDAIPGYTRDNAPHPNDTGRPDWRALQDDGVLARCFAAAMAAANKV